MTALALSADGNQILTGSADKTVRLSTYANGQQVRVFPGPAAAVTSVALGGPLGRRRHGRRPPVPLERRRWQLVRQVAAHGGPVTGVAFNARATQMLTAGGDGLLKLWALPAGRRRAS